MSDKEKYQKVLNHLIKKKYPFIENVKVVKLERRFSELSFYINLYLSRETMIESVDYDCIDKIPKEESIFMSLFSFSLCSNNKIKRSEFEDYLLSIYRASIESGTILLYSPTISVISPNIYGQYI